MELLLPIYLIINIIKNLNYIYILINYLIYFSFFKLFLNYIYFKIIKFILYEFKKSTNVQTFINTEEGKSIEKIPHSTFEQNIYICGDYDINFF